MEEKNYQELYLHMVRESEKAIRILIEAQRACEEKFLVQSDNEEEEEA